MVDLATKLMACFDAQISGHNVIPYIEGPPGIGKTVVVKDIAKAKGWGFKEIILSRYGALDIQGLHVPDYNEGVLKHFPTTRLLTVDSDKEFTLAFFDEFSNAQGDGQAAIQSLLESRELEGHKVPNNLLFVMAGNGPDHGCNARPLPNSIIDRITLIKYEVDKEFVKSWKKWADANSDLINPFVMAYIECSSEPLYTFRKDLQSGEKFASPRGWVKLSGFLNSNGVKNKDVLKCIATGIIGEVEAAKFINFMKIIDDLPKWGDIITNPDKCVVPAGLNSKFAVIASIENNIKHANLSVLSQTACENIIKYITKLSEELHVYAVRRFQKASKVFTNSNASTELEIKYNDIWNNIINS